MNWNPLARCTDVQREQLRSFQVQLLSFNSRINLISSQTEAQFLEHHLLHVLTLTYKSFPDGSTIVDWGTGGGLPAIPLAIMFPEVTVYAVDAVQKKINVVQVIARRLGLKNLHAWNGRAESWPGEAHYSVSRATASLATLYRWHMRAFNPEPLPLDAPHWNPGLICLKGGDLYMEIKELRQRHPAIDVTQIPLSSIIDSPFFKGKEIVAVTAEGPG